MEGSSPGLTPEEKERLMSGSEVESRMDLKASLLIFAGLVLACALIAAVSMLVRFREKENHSEVGHMESGAAAAIQCPEQVFPADIRPQICSDCNFHLTAPCKAIRPESTETGRLVHTVPAASAGNA